jgi:Leucine-rich repeat (LRR) protein
MPADALLLDDHQLETLPLERLQSARPLRHLSLYRNRLVEISPTLWDFTELETLNLADNRLHAPLRAVAHVGLGA